MREAFTPECLEKNPAGGPICTPACWGVSDPRDRCRVLTQLAPHCAGPSPDVIAPQSVHARTEAPHAQPVTVLVTQEQVPWGSWVSALVPCLGSDTAPGRGRHLHLGKAKQTLASGSQGPEGRGGRACLPRRSRCTRLHTAQHRVRRQRPDPSKVPAAAADFEGGRLPLGSCSFPAGVPGCLHTQIWKAGAGAGRARSGERRRAQLPLIRPQMGLGWRRRAYWEGRQGWVGAAARLRGTPGLLHCPNSTNSFLGELIAFLCWQRRHFCSSSLPSPDGMFFGQSGPTWSPPHSLHTCTYTCTLPGCQECLRRPFRDLSTRVPCPRLCRRGLVSRCLLHRAGCLQANRKQAPGGK